MRTTERLTEAVWDLVICAGREATGAIPVSEKACFAPIRTSGTRLSWALRISCKTTAVFRVASLRNSRVTRSRQAFVAFPRQVRSPMRQKYRSRICATFGRAFFAERQTAMISRIGGPRARWPRFWQTGSDHPVHRVDRLLQDLPVVEGVDHACSESVFRCVIALGQDRGERERKDQRVLEAVGKVENETARARLAVKDRHVWRDPERPEGGASHAVAKVVPVIDQVIDLPHGVLRVRLSLRSRVAAEFAVLVETRHAGKLRVTSFRELTLDTQQLLDVPNACDILREPDADPVQPVSLPHFQVFPGIGAADLFHPLRAIPHDGFRSGERSRFFQVDGKHLPK